MTEINNNKIYYNQQDVINEISNDTGYTKYNIKKVLDSLGNILSNKLMKSGIWVEIKIFPGLKITSKFLPMKQSNIDFCKNGLIHSDILKLDAKFSKRFKEKIRN